MSSNKPHADTAFWDSKRNRITSRKGGWRIGEAVYNQGYSQLDDLVGGHSYFQVMILNTTGRMVDIGIARWLEAAFVCASWPDSRIWCNQMGAIAGTLRASAVSGTVAGCVASDSIIYGPGVLDACTDFIREAVKLEQNGMSVPEIVQAQMARKNSVPGFARPVAKGDERVTALQRVREAEGIAAGPHELMAQEVNDYLAAEYDEAINVGGYLVAVLSDMDFSRADIHRMNTLIVAAGVQACHAEQEDNPAGSYLPMRVEDMIYEGKEDRELP